MKKRRLNFERKAPVSLLRWVYFAMTGRDVWWLGWL